MTFTAHELQLGVNFLKEKVLPRIDKTWPYYDTIEKMQEITQFLIEAQPNRQIATFILVSDFLGFDLEEFFSHFRQYLEEMWKKQYGKEHNPLCENGDDDSDNDIDYDSSKNTEGYAQLVADENAAAQLAEDEIMRAQDEAKNSMVMPPSTTTHPYAVDKNEFATVVYEKFATFSYGEKSKYADTHFGDIDILIDHASLGELRSSNPSWKKDNIKNILFGVDSEPTKSGLFPWVIRRSSSKSSSAASVPKKKKGGGRRQPHAAFLTDASPKFVFDDDAQEGVYNYPLSLSNQSALEGTKKASCARRGWILKQDLPDVDAWWSDPRPQMSSICARGHFLFDFITSVDKAIREKFNKILNEHYCHRFHFIRNALQLGGFDLHTDATDGEWTVVINLFNNGDPEQYKKINNSTGIVMVPDPRERPRTPQFIWRFYQSEFDCTLFRSNLLHRTVMNIEDNETCPETVKLAMFYVANKQQTSRAYVESTKLGLNMLEEIVINYHYHLYNMRLNG